MGGGGGGGLEGKIVFVSSLFFTRGKPLIKKCWVSLRTSYYNIQIKIFELLRSISHHDQPLV